MWMAWSPGAPEHERNIIILSYVKICNESPTGKYFPFASLWDINSSSMTQTMILLLAVMVMMVMMKKVTAFSKTTTLFEAQNSRKQCINCAFCSPAHGNKTPGSLCCPGHSGFLCSHCSWFKCGHHSLCLSFSNIGSQENLRGCTVIELYSEGL